MRNRFDHLLLAANSQQKAPKLVVSRQVIVVEPERRAFGGNRFFKVIELPQHKSKVGLVDSDLRIE